MLIPTPAQIANSDANSGCHLAFVPNLWTLTSSPNYDYGFGPFFSQASLVSTQRLHPPPEPQPGSVVSAPREEASGDSTQPEILADRENGQGPPKAKIIKHY